MDLSLLYEILKDLKLDPIRAALIVSILLGALAVLKFRRMLPAVFNGRGASMTMGSTSNRKINIGDRVRISSSLMRVVDHDRGTVNVVVDMEQYKNKYATVVDVIPLKGGLYTCRLDVDGGDYEWHPDWLHKI